MSHEEAPSQMKEYRPAKYLLVLGIISTVFFASAGVVSSGAALLNVDGSFRFPVPTAIFFGFFWSCWTLLGGWVLLAYFRERLYVTPELVRVVGSFRTREFRLCRVTRAIWKGSGWSASLTLYDTGKKIRVDLGNFKPHERAELIHYFRLALPEQVQERWEAFEMNCSGEVPVLDPKKRRSIRRARFYSILGGLSVIGLIAWDPANWLSPKQRWSLNALLSVKILLDMVRLRSRLPTREEDSSPQSQA